MARARKTEEQKKAAKKYDQLRKADDQKAVKEKLYEQKE